MSDLTPAPIPVPVAPPEEMDEDFSDLPKQITVTVVETIRLDLHSLDDFVRLVHDLPPATGLALTPEGNIRVIHPSLGEGVIERKSAVNLTGKVDWFDHLPARSKAQALVNATLIVQVDLANMVWCGAEVFVRYERFVRMPTVAPTGAVQ